MSQRMGMADGRCFTMNQSNQLLYEGLAGKVGVNPLDSGLLRTTLERADPDVVQGFVPDAGHACGLINYQA